MPVTQSICFINKISVIEAFYYTVIQLNVIYEKFAHILFHLYYNYYKPHKSLEILFASASLHFLSIQEEEIWHQPERVGDPHVPEADQLPIMGGDDYYLHGRLKGWWRVYVNYVLYDNSNYDNFNLHLPIGHRYRLVDSKKYSIHILPDSLEPGEIYSWTKNKSWFTVLQNS